MSEPLKGFIISDVGYRDVRTGSTRNVEPPLMSRYEEWPNHTNRSVCRSSLVRSVLTALTADFGARSAGFGAKRNSHIVVQRLLPDVIMGVALRFWKAPSR